MAWGKFGLYQFLPTLQHVQAVKEIYIYIFSYLAPFKRLISKQLRLSVISESLLISHSVLYMNHSILPPYLLSLKALPVLLNPIREYPLSSRCAVLISFLQTLTDVDYCCSLPFFALFRTKSFTALPQIRVGASLILDCAFYP